MPAAMIPATESDRLADLADSGLLRRRPRGRIRVLTELAGSLLQRPSAALSLVTANRQVFRPGIGLPHGSTPRNVSFCAHAILRPDEPLVVPDARLDARFADNRLVTADPPLRFYAGMPVRGPRGHPIGALCVLDCVPGALSDAQVDILRGLAREVDQAIAQECPAPQAAPTLLSELRETILVGGFTFQWQPIVTTDTLWPVGHEALIRWRRRDGTTVAPDTFIPLAETSGLIGRIDRLALQTVCGALATRGGGRVSVNISAGWFSQSRTALPDVVAAILASTGLSSDRLVIEVTERVLIADPARAMREMRELAAMGVHTALDDFGTGYSSLSYLEAFPFQTVKLDKAFVRGLGLNARAEAIARAVIRLGHDLGMTICAEGVETWRQLAFLRQEGCDQAQGFLLGEPADLV